MGVSIDFHRLDITPLSNAFADQRLESAGFWGLAKVRGSGTTRIGSDLLICCGLTVLNVPPNSFAWCFRKITVLASSLIRMLKMFAIKDSFPSEHVPSALIQRWRWSAYQWSIWIDQLNQMRINCSGSNSKTAVSSFVAATCVVGVFGIDYRNECLLSDFGILEIQVSTQLDDIPTARGTVTRVPNAIPKSDF